jgi:hypothetical protein
MCCDGFSSTILLNGSLQLSHLSQQSLQFLLNGGLRFSHVFRQSLQSLNNYYMRGHWPMRW